MSQIYKKDYTPTPHVYNPPTDKEVTAIKKEITDNIVTEEKVYDISDAVIPKLKEKYPQFTDDDLGKITAELQEEWHKETEVVTPEVEPELDEVNP